MLLEYDDPDETEEFDNASRDNDSDELGVWIDCGRCSYALVDGNGTLGGTD